MLESKKLWLAPLEVDGVTEEYVEWLNDLGTSRFLDSKFGQTRSSVQRYVANFQPPNVLCRILVKEGQRHVGNIALHRFHPIHRRIELGILIGVAEARGQGIGQEACSLLIQYAFDHLNIHKITAGTVVDNEAMTKTFTKLGFVIEGTLRQEYYLEGTYRDVHHFGLLREQFIPHHESVR